MSILGTRGTRKSFGSPSVVCGVYHGLSISLYRVLAFVLFTLSYYIGTSLLPERIETTSNLTFALHYIPHPDWAFSVRDRVAYVILHCD